MIYLYYYIFLVREDQRAQSPSAPRNDVPKPAKVYSLALLQLFWISLSRSSMICSLEVGSGRIYVSSPLYYHHLLLFKGPLKIDCLRLLGVRA